MADWAAVAVDNARAHAQSRRDKRQAEVALRGLEETAVLNREVVGRGDLDPVIELAVKRGRSLADARSAVLLLVDGDTLKVVAVAGEVGKEVIGREAPEAGSIASRSACRTRSADHPGCCRPVLRGQPAGGSGVIVPLRARGADIGVLAVFDRLDPEHPLGPTTWSRSSPSPVCRHQDVAARALEDERLSLSISYSERERRRWARELHDETLQELGALNVMQESALQVDDDEAAKTALARSNEQVGQIIAGLQGLITSCARRHWISSASAPRSRSWWTAFDCGAGSTHRSTSISPPTAGKRQRASPGARGHDLPPRPGGADERRQACGRHACAGESRGGRSHRHGHRRGRRPRLRCRCQQPRLRAARNARAGALSGGELSVESSPEGGARLTATLPVERAPQDAAPG